jgi:hypothetical protein
MGPEDRMAGWAEGGNAVFVQHGTTPPAGIERLDLLTGRREPRFTLNPAGRGIPMSSVSADGRAYVYQYSRDSTTLFLVTGMKDR